MAFKDSASYEQGMQRFDFSDGSCGLGSGDGGSVLGYAVNGITCLGSGLAGGIIGEWLSGISDEGLAAL